MSSWSSSRLGLLNHEDEGGTVLRNVRTYSPVDMSSQKTGILSNTVLRNPYLLHIVLFAMMFIQAETNTKLTTYLRTRV